MLVKVQLPSFLVLRPIDIGLSPLSGSLYSRLLAVPGLIRVTQSLEVAFKLSGSDVMKFVIKSF